MKKFVSILAATAIMFSIFIPSVSADSTVTVNVDAPSYAAASVRIASDFESAEKAIENAMANMDTSVNLYKYHISTSDISNLYMNTVFDNPEYYYVESRMSYNYDPTSNIITGIKFSYWEDKAAAAAQKSAMDAAIEAALSGIEDGMSDTEKVLYLHDYLADLVDYDYENYLSNSLPNSVFTAYGALVDHLAVCQGYSLAFVLLCKELGINSKFILSDSMNHAWNAVQLDGEWYFLDITQDDTIMNMNSYYLYKSQTSHQRFLLSSSELSAKGYYDWYYFTITDETIAPSAGMGTNIWSDNTTGMGYYNGLWYYKEGGKLYSSKIDGSQKKQVFNGELSGSQLTFSEGRVYYYSGTDIYSLNLYFADETRSGDLNKSVLLASETNGGRVCGISSADGIIYYEYVDAGGAYSVIELDTADAVAARKADIIIDKIAVVTKNTQRSDVTAARSAFDELNDVQKALMVYGEDTIISAEKAIDNIPDILYGDIDFDGRVTVSDVVLLRSLIMKGNTENVVYFADLDGDSAVTVSDIVTLRAYIMAA